MLSRYGIECVGKNVEVEGVVYRQNVEHIKGTKDIEGLEGKKTITA